MFLKINPNWKIFVAFEKFYVCWKLLAALKKHCHLKECCFNILENACNKTCSASWHNDNVYSHHVVHIRAFGKHFLLWRQTPHVERYRNLLWNEDLIIRRQHCFTKKITLFSNSLLQRRNVNKLFIVSCSRGYYNKIQWLLLGRW